MSCQRRITGRDRQADMVSMPAMVSAESGNFFQAGRKEADTGKQLARSLGKNESLDREKHFFMCIMFSNISFSPSLSFCEKTGGLQRIFPIQTAENSSFNPQNRIVRSTTVLSAKHVHYIHILRYYVFLSDDVQLQNILDHCAWCRK